MFQKLLEIHIFFFNNFTITFCFPAEKNMLKAIRDVITGHHCLQQCISIKILISSVASKGTTLQHLTVIGTKITSKPLFFYYLKRKQFANQLTKQLTLSPPSTTIVPYANSLDPDETPSNSASHLDPNCLTLGQHFHQL